MEKRDCHCPLSSLPFFFSSHYKKWSEGIGSDPILDFCISPLSTVFFSLSLQKVIERELGMTIFLISVFHPYSHLFSCAAFTTKNVTLA